MEQIFRREKEKQIHESEIIAAAEKVFYLKGYEDCSMDVIAKEAQFTKRTVYQYFESKEDLYFAVVLKGFKRLHSTIMEANKKARTGYERLENFCRTYYLFYRDNPDVFRLINYWGNVRKKTEDESKKKSELIQFNKDLFQKVEEIIKEGKGDGSIQADIDPKKSAYSLVFLMIGFFNQLSTTGNNYTEYFSLNHEDFSFYTIEIVLKTLKRSKITTTTRKGTV